jgi:hypothetical protein
MTDTTRTVVMKLTGRLLSALVHLGIGIYSAVILANNSKEIVPTEVYGFTMTICILHFVAFVNSLYLAFIPNKKSVTLVNLAVLGLFIWSAVILFAQDGNLLKSSNPYYMVVFVYFVITATLIGLSIIIVPCACCFVCYKLFQMDEKEKAAVKNNIEVVQKNIDAVLKECEMAIVNIDKTDTHTAISVPVPKCPVPVHKFHIPICNNV